VCVCACVCVCVCVCVFFPRAQLYIVLRRSCNLKEFALTVTGGAGDAAYPVYLDLFIGPYLNRLRCVAPFPSPPGGSTGSAVQNGHHSSPSYNSIVMQDLLIPRVTVGTKLYYEVPAHTWTAYEGPSIYDFGGTLSPCFALVCTCLVVVHAHYDND
jgi:hypothetical protein